MSTDYLETAVDKFIFKIKKDYLYSQSHVWLKVEDGEARAGITDYMQQTAGDITFVEFRPVETELKTGDGLAGIDSIKTTIDILSPASGSLYMVNGELDDKPELVNEDPYGTGWLALIKLSDWDNDRAGLLTAEEYLQFMRRKAEEEAKKL